MFGRGGEEALALRAAGIAVRDRARRDRRASPPAPTPASPSPSADWRARSRSSPATRIPARDESVDRLAGAGGLPRDARALHGRAAACPRSPPSLIAAGRAASEPAAVVESGTLPGQRTVTGTLATIAQEVAQRAGSAPPSVTVVGPVAALARRAGLAAAQARCRAGRVAVTRARERRRASWRGGWGSLGARVVQAPVIRTQAAARPAARPLTATT